MIRISLVAAVITAALAVAGLASAKPSITSLTGTVGPGFTITLKKGTKKVTVLPSGLYKITVVDKSSIHNWVLKGPGIIKRGREVTGVGFTGTKTDRVTLKKGTYTYVCTPHAAVMKGTFKVT
jgi:plastocyanin